MDDLLVRLPQDEVGREGARQAFAGGREGGGCEGLGISQWRNPRLARGDAPVGHGRPLADAIFVQKITQVVLYQGPRPRTQ